MATKPRVRNPRLDLAHQASSIRGHRASAALKALEAGRDGSVVLVPDVTADVAKRCARAGLPVDWSRYYAPGPDKLAKLLDSALEGWWTPTSDQKWALTQLSQLVRSEAATDARHHQAHALDDLVGLLHGIVSGHKRSIPGQQVASPALETTHDTNFRVFPPDEEDE